MLDDELVSNCLSGDGGLVPAQPVIEVPLLEPLADVVDGDVLRPLRSPYLLRNEYRAHGLVRELDEGTLHECDDRRVIPVGWNRQLEIRPRGLPLGIG